MVVLFADDTFLYIQDKKEQITQPLISRTKDLTKP